jgi:scyllo-inositol 2-dehydrogenase (NADP+)
VFHGPLVSHTPGLRVAAVFSRTAERRNQAAAQYPEAKTHDTYAALLEDPEVQLVVVGTPHDTHEAMVVEAARARKHVVVDKIMCLSVAEGERMIAAAREAGVVFSVFQNRRWDSDYLTVRSVLERGLVGVPYVIESAVTSFGPSPGYRNPTSDRPRGWRTYAEFGGGPMRDWGAHLFDQAVQLAGPAPLSVYADFQYRRKWDVETAGMAYLKYAGSGESTEGLRYVIETGSISAIQRPRWYIRGSEGTYLQYGRDPQEAALNRGEVGPRVMDPESAPRLVRYVDGKLVDVACEQVPGNYLAFYANVRDALLGEAELAVKPENVLYSIRLIEMAVKSAQTNLVVPYA